MTVTELMGVQTPRVSLVPPYVSNAADEAYELCAAYGLILDDWQTLVLTAWLGENEEGNWAATSNGLSLPRQNGKGVCLLARELLGAVILGERILHTAHLLKTSKDHFERMLALIDNSDELQKLVLKVVRTNGEEAIKFKNGAVIKFVARSKNSGRGFTADLLVCDEAQDMSDDDFAALQPTLYSVSNPQTILVGTPPVPTIDGTVWNRFKDLGSKPDTQHFSWLEWSADRNDDLSNVETWAKANPSLGYRGEVASVRNEYTTMDDETFARERLGMWSGIASNTLFDMELWDSLKNTIPPKEPYALGIDVSPNMDRASIGLAGYLGKAVHLEVSQSRTGTDWVVPYLKKMLAQMTPVAIVIDSRSPAMAVLKTDLDAARIRIIDTNATDMANACGLFYSMVNGGAQGEGVEKVQRLFHGNQDSLNAAVASATKRPIGQAFGWNRANPHADITPLIAVTLAMHGLITKRPPKDDNAPKRKALLLR